MGQQEADALDVLEAYEASAVGRNCCAYPGCGVRFFGLGLRAMKHTLQKHYCSRCQGLFCHHHTQYSPHGLLGSCGLDSKCICILCWREIPPARQEFLNRSNKLHQAAHIKRDKTLDRRQSNPDQTASSASRLAGPLVMQSLPAAPTPSSHPDLAAAGPTAAAASATSRSSLLTGDAGENVRPTMAAHSLPCLHAEGHSAAVDPSLSHSPTGYIHSSAQGRFLSSPDERGSSSHMRLSNLESCHGAQLSPSSLVASHSSLVQTSPSESPQQSGTSAARFQSASGSSPGNDLRIQTQSQQQPSCHLGYSARESCMSPMDSQEPAVQNARQLPRRKSKNWTKASIAMQAMRRFVQAGEQGRARKQSQ